MKRFEGQNIVVTGGASGIGEATVKAIAAEGGRVIIADRQQERGQALASKLGSQALFHHTDVTQESAMVAAIELAEREFGPLTGFVNSAGIIGVTGPISETNLDDYEQTMAILCRAAFLGVKHAASAMKKHGKGSVVSLTSVAGISGGLGPHIYTMAKHAVIGLTKSAASELSRDGIRINAVAPAGTVTPMTAELAGGDETVMAEVIKNNSPLGIACMPQDIAHGILYLLSEEARYVTGHTLVIDAGMTSSSLQTDFHNATSPEG